MRKRRGLWLSTTTVLVALLAVTGCRGGILSPWWRSDDETQPIEVPKDDDTTTTITVEEPDVDEDDVEWVEVEEPDVRKVVFEPASDLQMINFEFDKSRITSEAAAILEKNAEIIRRNRDVVVQIEGHCDERGTSDYNLALGQRRASSTRDYLIKLGVDADRLATISYGEESPLDPRHNEEAWGKNRRAQFGRQQ